MLRRLAARCAVTSRQLNSPLIAASRPYSQFSTQTSLTLRSVTTILPSHPLPSLRLSPYRNSITPYQAISTTATLHHLLATPRPQSTVIVSVKEEFVRNKKEEKLPPERHLQYYVIEGHRDLARRSDIDVILQHNIEGVGRKYEVVTVSRSLARNKLLLSGAAIYASPQNLQRNLANAQEISAPQQSVNAQRSLRQLKAMTLRIYMNENCDWRLTAAHVRIAFRKQGVVVPETTIELLSDDICQYGRIEFNVTVNKLTKVKVNADIYPFNIDHSVSLPTASVFAKHKIPIGTILD